MTTNHPPFTPLLLLGSYSLLKNFKRSRGDSLQSLSLSPK
ncbi:hypothetical protein NEOC65_001720 [Neochlamydia sp. AcF65]|nr:hypothetical protein [Neochlamydia sp. AcF65]MBS4171341.1 hypothetical protein [Neochlamydia sp. AcF95]